MTTQPDRQFGFGTGYPDNTWELHGSDWRALSPTRRPPARSLAALWHDEDRGRTYLFVDSRARPAA